MLGNSVWVSPIFAQVITDGDTLEQGGVTYRLWGIDAPEAKQVCPDGWPAGSLAGDRAGVSFSGRGSGLRGAHVPISRDRFVVTDKRFRELLLGYLECPRALCIPPMAWR